MKIIIATTSLNRKELLKKFFPKAVFVPPDYNEKKYNFSFFPTHIVKKNSLKKAESIKDKNNLIIGFDTIIYKNFKIYNKPKDLKTAIKYLKELSGKWHNVSTGVSIIYDSKKVTFYVKSKVKFKKLSLSEISYYIKLGESLNRAGGYAIQNNALDIIIEKYQGDYFNIVGVPFYFLKIYLNNFIM